MKKYSILRYSLPPNTPPLHIPTPKIRTITIPNKLGKFTLRSCDSVADINLDSFIKLSRGRPHLHKLHIACRSATGLLNHPVEFGASTKITLCPTNKAQNRALAHGTHISPHRDSHFVLEELHLQAKAGDVILLLLSLVVHLPNFLLSPVAAFPQENRKLRLIYDCSFFGINKASVPLAPMEAVQFSRTFFRLLYTILHANPVLEPTHVSKIDLADGYMRVPLSTPATPKLTFLVPPHPIYDE